MINQEAATKLHDERVILRLQWRNVYDPHGGTYRLVTRTVFDRDGHALEPNTASVKSYRDVLNAYRIHPAAKSLGSDGRPCRRRTYGLLAPRPVTAASIAHIGNKEANLIEEIAAGLITAETDTLTTYESRPTTQPPRRCEGCDAELAGKQQRWCTSCRGNRRQRERVALDARAQRERQAAPR